MTPTQAPWSGLIPVDDTELYVTDTGGSGIPIVYLNGAYADLKHWRRVVDELGTDDWRHIRYDERARGRSKRSSDYSFEAAIRDVDAVLNARGVERAIVVGWSYGATLAMYWAQRNPDRVRGIVAVDGAMPYDWIDDAARERLRTMFRRMRPLLPLVAPFGLAARMSADDHADVNIEINEKLGGLDPVLDDLEVPVRYVVASGAHLGTEDDEIEKARATLDPVYARNPNIRESARVTVNHSKILAKAFGAVAAAVRETADAAEQQDAPNR